MKNKVADGTYRVDREKGVNRWYHRTHSWYSRRANFFSREHFSILKAVIKSFLPVLQSKYMKNSTNSLFSLQGKTLSWTLN